SASSSDGCIATPQTISITVDAITVNASSNSSNITCGDATQLTESNNYPGAGTLSYAWSPSTALSSASVSTPTANPISTTTYSLTIHTSDGCTGFNQTTINVNPLQINTTSQYSVGCHATVNLSTSSNSSNSDLTYTWTPSLGLSSTTVASPNAAVYHNTTYNVTMSLPSSGCANASNSANISFTIPSTPQICMVTVDSTSSYNTVYWDKTSYAGAAIDSFRIYRETSTNVYTQIGAVAYNSMSAFNDLEANPNTTTYRYKLSALDSCGNESALSYYHNTIYIISVGGGQFTWNPGYTIESSANPVTNYVLMRDDNNTGNFQQIASTSGTQNSINDVSYASHQSTANWRVDALGFNCNPSLRLAGGNNGTDAAKVKSHSNQNNNRTSSINKVAGNTQVIVYPNPANNVLNIDFAKPTTAVSVKITSLFGTEVYNSNQLPLSGNNLAIDISKFESGTYLVQITTDKVSEIKKIVKQ
ncbi:MAG TPA: T9SS type A sorting domain-containing protein, partial [Bacteroidia bacterium]